MDKPQGVPQMSDSTKEAEALRRQSIGRAAFLTLFLIPAVFTYFDDELAQKVLAGIGFGEVDLTIARALCYALMLLVCAVRSPFVHRWWLALLPAVAAAADLPSLPSIPPFSSILPLIPSLANLIALIAGFAAAPSRYQREIKVLVNGLVDLAPHLQLPDDPEALLAQAKEYGTEDDSRDQWQASKWLIDTRKHAAQQLLVSEDCLEKARRLNELAGADADLPPPLSDAYQGLLGNTANATNNDLREKLKAHGLAWRPIANAVRRIAMPRVFATEAFFRISERRGIQIASIVAAGLVVLGAVYMTCFYRAAVGIPVHDYWTLDDLFIQGMLVAPWALAALLLAELVFRGMFKHFEREEHTAGFQHAYRWFLDHPSAVAGLLVAGIIGFVALVGDVRGDLKLAEFYDWKLTDSESATVMDDSVLKHVFLVGTTSRTAIFKRVGEWNDAGHPKKPEPNDTGHPKKPEPPDEDKLIHDVIIMDRALVVCHAKGTICENLPVRTTSEGKVPDEAIQRIEDGMKGLDAKMDGGIETVREDVAGLANKFGLGLEEVDKEFDEVCRHLDRHQQQIVEAVDLALAELERSTKPTEANGSRSARMVIRGSGQLPCAPPEGAPISG